MVGLKVAPGMKSVQIDYTIHAPIPLQLCFKVQGFTVLLGRSGVGKTSLLKALAGLLPASGAPWNGLPPQLRSIGYLPQEALLFPHLSVLENVAYALHGPTRLKRAQDLLAELGLEQLARFQPCALSGGQAKRIALARALARDVELLVLDEPSAGLDTSTRDEMLDWLRTTISRRGIPALIATHDHHIAACADRIALLADGHILQSGTTHEVFAAPNSRAAAALLGYDNVFERNGNWWAIHAGDIIIDPQGEVFTIQAVQETALGLRLRCGPAPCVSVFVPHGGAKSYQTGAHIRLNMQKAVILEGHFESGSEAL